MKRVALCLCLMAFGLPGAAQTRLSDERLAEIETKADEIAAIDPGPVPDLLLLALIAAEDPDHLTRPGGTGALTRQLARLHIGAMRTLERRRTEDALAGALAARMTPEAIAGAYASLVYYGRNCFGYREAAAGLGRARPADAPEQIWLALAALPRAPSHYLGNRTALGTRVAGIIETLERRGLVSPKTAERLSDLPLANLDRGPGCR